MPMTIPDVNKARPHFFFPVKSEKALTLRNTNRKSELGKRQK